MRAFAGYLKLFLGLSLVATIATSCLEPEPYEECGFPSTIEQQCIPQPGDTDEEKMAKNSSNCVIEQPQCPEGFCVSFRGSPGFCSVDCQEDADCPSGGSCKELAFNCEVDDAGVTTCDRLCVKNSALAE
jgi:hypothetical protein